MLLLGCALLSAFEAWATEQYTVAIDADYPPYEYVEKGQVRGMLPELLRAIGRQQGMTFNFVAMDWPDAVDSLRQHKVDVVNMIHTEEREKHFLFSQPHSQINQAIFRNQKHRDIHHLDSLTGSIVAVQRGDIAEERLNNRKGISLLRVQNKADAFSRLQANEVAAVIAGEQAGLWMLKQHQWSHIELAQAALWPRPYAFAALPGNEALIARLNAGLSALKVSGEYTRIMEHWYITPRSWWHHWLLPSGIGVLLVFLLILSWNWLLQRRVESRSRELNREKSEHRKLLEILPEAVLLIRQHEVSYANAAAMRLFDVEGKEAMWPVLIKAWPGLIDRLDQHATWYGRKDLLCLGGRSIELESSAITTLYLGSNATLLLLRDVTSQRQQEMEQRRLMQILDQTSDCVVLCNEQGKILYYNPAADQLLNLHAMDMQLSFADLHAKEEADVVLHHYLPECARQGSIHVETVLQTSDGNTIPVSAVYIAHSSHHRPGHYSLIARDIRQQLAHHSRNERSQRLESMGRLAGNIAHDFNNIMMAILGNATLARMRLGEDATATAYLQRIEESGKRAASLCKQMLAYSGRGNSTFRLFDLAAWLQDMQGWIQGSMPSTLELHFDISQSGMTINGDPRQLQQMLMNVLLNASEAIQGAPGHITLSVRSQYLDEQALAHAHGDSRISSGDYVCLAVEDNGCGMSEDVRQHIFDPFFTTRSSGRGLGMSMVLGVVRSHHGCIRLESAPNRGTKVELFFPQVKEVRSPLSGRGDEQTEDGQLTGSHEHYGILVVDDERQVREAAALLLQSLGHRTFLADGGESALNIYRQQSQDIQLVLLDMSMPGMDGQQCFQELRKLNPEVRVLLTSGFTDIDIGERFAGQQLTGFIAKPYTPKELQRKLNEVFAA